MVPSPTEPARAVITRTQTERSEKHLAMHEAIRRIALVIDKIDALIGNIRGTPPPDEPDVEVKEILPSLEQVLDHGPDNINEKIDIMVQKLDEIQGVLF